MIVDSSALTEQVVQDVLASAFDSAGQRCSALRVLCLQSEIADRTLAMLRGAMQELRIGNPDRLAIDVGPVIDAEARQNLLAHIERFRQTAKACHQLPLPPGHEHGTFVAPIVLEINSLSELTQEVFGPVLHVIRYRRSELPQLVDAINASGFGLTLGIHSRIDETVDFISTYAHVGNIYVNRNIVGAVVGVQPFGGEGKSGTGPKAGGPLYLKRLQRETITVDEIFGPIVHNSVAPELALLSSWAEMRGHDRLAQHCAAYAKFSALHKTILLPGPTGERNTLSFAPRGTVLCAAAGTPAILNQVAAALACGNQVVILRNATQLLPNDLPPIVLSKIKVLDRIDSAQHGIHGVLVEPGRASDASDLLLTLAAQNGAVIPVIRVAGDQPIPLWRLLAERALCINTTAAGGNASLMTLDEHGDALVLNKRSMRARVA
jgi:RHH-type proline utilization regulon transcriptional repressor/proline dehydrogenase/delta 1-pyrroline-5-carboxylate dehydrogenase